MSLSNSNKVPLESRTTWSKKTREALTNGRMKTASRGRKQDQRSRRKKAWTCWGGDGGLKHKEMHRNEEKKTKTGDKGERGREKGVRETDQTDITEEPSWVHWACVTPSAHEPAGAGLSGLLLFPSPLFCRLPVNTACSGAMTVLKDEGRRTSGRPSRAYSEGQLDRHQRHLVSKPDQKD